MSFRRIPIFALSVFVAAMLAPASRTEANFWKEVCEADMDPALHAVLCGNLPSMLEECRAEWEKAPARVTCTSGASDMTYERGMCKLVKLCTSISQTDGAVSSRSNTFFLFPHQVAGLCADSITGEMSKC